MPCLTPIACCFSPDANSDRPITRRSPGRPTRSCPRVWPAAFIGSRIVAFSTGNVYPFVPVPSRGCVETDATSPRGEYAQSCLGRERVFEYFSRERGTPVLIFRLNYAVDFRYGVLVDIARAVKAGQPVDRTVSHFNAIWQGDANSYALRSLEGCASPPKVLNVTGGDVPGQSRTLRSISGGDLAFGPRSAASQSARPCSAMPPHATTWLGQPPCPLTSSCRRLPTGSGATVGLSTSPHTSKRPAESSNGDPGTEATLVGRRGDSRSSAGPRRTTSSGRTQAGGADALLPGSRSRGAGRGRAYDAVCDS